MSSAPVRQPAFCLLCIVALFSVAAARQQDPVTALVVEQIETRYAADRTSCASLVGIEKRDCRAAAELRYDVAINELNRLSNEPETPTPDHQRGPLPAANVALGSGGSPS